MPRNLRSNVPNTIYHVLNRANAKSKIFDSEIDYSIFLQILINAVKKFKVKLYNFCIMPNHWHLVLKPLTEGEMSQFMKYLTQSHVQNWHIMHKTTGTGHLYQGRYKSFPVQTDEYLLQLIRYIERNPLRAGLVSKVEDWHYNSLWYRQYNIDKGSILSIPPLINPENYLDFINQPQTLSEIEDIRKTINLNSQLGVRSGV
jgi:putative transposase